MLIRGGRRLLPFLITSFVLVLILLKLHNEGRIKLPYRTGEVPGFLQQNPDSKDVSFKSGHRELFSLSTPDRAYFLIEFAPQGAINPNIIPHPVLNDTYIIVAMQQKSTVKLSVWAAELVCNAIFQNGRLECTSPPQILPIGVTKGNTSECDGNLLFLTLNTGPHDARVFYGPSNPFAIYGSNAMFNCFGQWMSDFRTLYDWSYERPVAKQIRMPTELQRPLPYGKIEKNYFVFWDREGQIYAHYEVSPKRVFAKLAVDGSVGEDLAPLSRANDEQCMKQYMPKVADASTGKKESIHQATNSLAITNCKRSDPSCVPNADNTFIMTIFQQKYFVGFHSTYDPYVMLFRQEAPFEVVGISTKPLWIHGRGGLGSGVKPDAWRPWTGPLEGERGYDLKAIMQKQESERPWRKQKSRSNPGEKYEGKPWLETEMFYITSMSWKQQGQKYHGYIDDVLFVAFGIEDADTAAIDILGGDLLQDIGFCSALPKPDVSKIKIDERPVILVGESATTNGQDKGNEKTKIENALPNHDAHQGFKELDHKNAK